MLIAGDDPISRTLQRQAIDAFVIKREHTGVGWFVDIGVADDVPVVDPELDTYIRDVVGEIEGVERGVGFVLFVREGRISLLEGFSYNEPWPPGDRAFKLGYIEIPRASWREGRQTM